MPPPPASPPPAPPVPTSPAASLDAPSDGHRHEAVPHPPEHEAHREHGEHEAHHPHGHFSTLLAFGIAIVSIMAAIVTWRAEVAASGAVDAMREGLVVSANAVGVEGSADARAHADEAGYRRYFGYVQQAKEYAAQAAAATDPNVKASLQRRAAVEEALVKAFRYLYYPDYTKTTSSTDTSGDLSFDLDRRKADLIRETRVNTDSERFFARADELEHHKSTLFQLDIALVLALALLTVAQLARTRPRALGFAVPGAGLFLAATAAFLVVEV